MRSAPFVRLAALSAVLVLGGCHSPAMFLDPKADVTYYERVGVLPFSSLATDRVAGDKVSNVFFTELLESRRAAAVDPGQLAAAMVQIRGGTPAGNPWSQAELAKLAAAVNAQGIFEGVVREYTLQRSGRDEFPLVSLELRLVDPASGRVIWSWSDTRRGGPAFPLWPWRETRTLGELTAQMCRDALATLR